VSERLRKLKLKPLREFSLRDLLVVGVPALAILFGGFWLAAQEVHREPGIFQRPGESPRAGDADFPLAPQTERFYKSGKPFLQRYGELKFLEAQLETNPALHSRAEWLEKLDRIDEDVQHIPTPLAFADMLYTLRSHVGLVRATILRRAPLTVPAETKAT